MPRRLPDPIAPGPEESPEDFAARRMVSKRRLQIFKRIYQNYHLWAALIEAGEAEDILFVDGEEIYYYDLMVGLDTLPPRQRQAFELICVQGYTESAATAIMLPNSRWSTPVQQYSDQALLRMIVAYDAKQRGESPLPASKRNGRSSGPSVSPSVKPVASASTPGGTEEDASRRSAERNQLQTGS